ncbi:MAG: RNA polymerase sigma factor [Bryobacteraceae bacterium]
MSSRPLHLVPVDLEKVRSERHPMTAEELVTNLFVEARDDVYRYLLTLGLHPPQAQEATQEVFLRLYVTLRKGEDLQSPRAWVFRVAHNHGLNVRAKENGNRMYTAELPERPDPCQLSPEQSLLERERLSILKEAVASLSEQQRQCLYLRSEGFRYREIAEIMGIGTSTVGEFLRRGVSRLKRVRHE